MLWHLIAYIVLILPFAVARFSTSSGISVASAVAIFTSAVFVLTGLVNTVLFCTTRNDLPGNWRQRFGIGALLANGRTDVCCLFGGIQLGRAASAVREWKQPVEPLLFLISGMEKGVETKHSQGDPILSLACQPRLPDRSKLTMAGNMPAIIVIIFDTHHFSHPSTILIRSMRCQGVYIPNRGVEAVRGIAVDGYMRNQ